jgi:hypothetical protein
MRRSTLRALLVSTLVSLIVAIGAVVVLTRGGGGGAQDMAGIQSQLATLREETRVLNAAVAVLQAEILANPAAPRAEVASATPARVAPAATPAAALAAAPEQTTEDWVTRLGTPLSIDSSDSSERQARASLEALEQRQEDQRRRLFVSVVECRAEPVDAMAICVVSVRNNDDIAIPVNLSQSGSRARVIEDLTFTSIRMRQLGQNTFGYGASVSIPGKSSRGFEIAFGPVAQDTQQIEEINLNVNKMNYQFADVSLTH